ncbi:S-adenosyl-L-methionine-dependent methyltransferase [Schizophyllum amplum]|uniref:tRNA N(3)-methylcytidine methyltransferase n=1 Tax=Schizophyllum amplum TaxID=97359 RepID=A0A550C1N5_9AGAR|nr:S-adenosyl-L-methionine-dependent methyltransferase [Auriculariopsis ampla]
MAAPQKPKTTSSVHDAGKPLPPFGSRFLDDEARVWEHNAWDHVPPPDDQGERIAASLAKQRAAPVPEDEKDKYNGRPSKHWDNFYKNNADNFFKDRKWMQNEFPELLEATKPDAGPKRIVEVGCGAGNAIFPLLSLNKNPELDLRAYDYSNHAVKVVQHSDLYLNPPLGQIHASPWDLTSDDLPNDIEEGSVDIVTLIFVLSALHPDEWCKAMSNIHRMLKPGGRALLRDYGRHDLAQLRFKGGRLLDDNLYVRGDKTRVYFFELDELALMFTGSRMEGTGKTTSTLQVVDETDADGTGYPALQSSAPHSPAPSSGTDMTISGEALQSILDDAAQGTHAASAPSTSSAPSTPSTPSEVHANVLSPLPGCPAQPMFDVEQLGVDRRLIVNRKRKLKMYRVWMQGKFRKL